MHPQDYSTSPARLAPPGALMWPAMTLLPFLRAPLGEAVVSPRLVIGMTALLTVAVPCLGTIWCGMASRPAPSFAPLILFGLAYLVAGIATWLKRRQGLPRGEAIHSFDYGQSWIVPKLPYPRPVSEILIIPVVIMSAGYVATYSFLATFGYWLVISGASLLILAQWEYRLRRARYRAMVDDVISAQAAEANMRAHEHGGFTAREESTGEADTDFTADLRRRRQP